MATIIHTQPNDRWFSKFVHRLRTSKRRKTLALNGKAIVHHQVVDVDDLDMPSKSLVSSESDETLPMPPSKIEEAKIPPTQQALTVAAIGRYNFVEDFPTPTIQGRKDVLIRNHAVALNPIDWKSVSHNFCLRAFPWVTGRELAGVVMEVGEDVKNTRPGDRVWTSTYYKDIRAGCFQDYVVVPEHTVCRMPAQLSFESAACLGVGALTAATTLWKWMDVQMPSQTMDQIGDAALGTVLIWGEGSVTGQFATQLVAKAGMRVIVVGSQKVAAQLQRLGASHSVIRDGKTNDEIIAEVIEAGGNSVTRAIDLVGQETVPSCLRTISGSTAVIFAPLAMMALDQEIPENVTVANVEMRRFVLDYTSRIYSEELNRLVEAGQLQLPEIEILEGGLGVVEAGLQRLKMTGSSGKKLVVSVAP